MQTQLGIGFAAGIQTRASRRYSEIRNTPAMLYSCIVRLQCSMCEIDFGLPSVGNMPTKLLHVSLCLCCLKTVVICFIETEDPWEYVTDYGEATGKEQLGERVAAIQSAYSLRNGGSRIMEWKFQHTMHLANFWTWVLFLSILNCFTAMCAVWEGHTLVHTVL